MKPVRYFIKSYPQSLICIS